MRKLCLQYTQISIKLSNTNVDQANNVIVFKGFPQVVGVVDGTHIRIQAPSANEDDYVNRKGFHSLNVQVKQ